MMSNWRELLCSEKALQIVAKEPHLLGHIIGKEKLQPIHSEWIRYVWDTNKQRALMAYRGSYKTTAICTVGIIRWMLFHPDERIALFRKHVGKAADVVNTVAQAMEYSEVAEIFKYKLGYYPKAKVKSVGRLQYNFKKTSTPEPNVLSLGLDGDITGQHFDKIILDDFVTVKDRVSRAERRHTKLALMEIQTNIIDPSKGVSYIGTPWHRDDAWRYVNSICSIAKYPITKYGYIVGEEEIERKRNMTTPSLFAANYDLDLIKDESLLFNDPKFSDGWVENYHEVIAQLDAAYGGSNFCALTIASKLRVQGEETYYQAVGFTYLGNIRDWYDEIVRICKRYKVSYLLEESNADKGMSADDLSKRGLRIRSYNEKQNKHLKISTNLYKVWRYIEWAPETDDEYMSQVIDYQEGSSPDDAPDSAASLFREAFNKMTEFDREALAYFHGKE